MSARMQTELVNYDPAAPGQKLGVLNVTEAQVEALFRNFEPKDLVAPLRHIRRGPAHSAGSPAATEQRRREAVALQEQWNTWMRQRDQFRADIKRGQEVLEQVRTDLETLRSRLEEWSSDESICGRNPLPEYIQQLLVKERIEQFLPMWLKRREEQLQCVLGRLEACARENDLEHLLG